MGLVEGDQLLQGLGRKIVHVRQAGKIGIEIVLELVEQHVIGRRPEAFLALDGKLVDHRRPCRLEVGDRRIEKTDRPQCGTPPWSARRRSAFPSSPSLRRWSWRVQPAAFSAIPVAAVGLIPADHGCQQGDRVGHASRHRPRRVLGVGDRHHSGPADQADRRFDPDDAIGGCGADDRTVRLGTDRNRGQAGCSGGPRSRTRAARIAGRIVRVVRLAADSAPTAGGALGPEVGPFAEIGLAEDDGPGLPQTGNKKCVAPRDIAGQRQRTGGRRHRVAGLDVVLEEDRDAVQRPSHLVLPPLLVEGPRLGHRLRIGDDDGVQHGVEALDPLQVGPRDRLGTHRARFHQSLEIGDTRLDDQRIFPCAGPGGGTSQQEEQCRNHYGLSFLSSSFVDSRHFFDVDILLGIRNFDPR